MKKLGFLFWLLVESASFTWAQDVAVTVSNHSRLQFDRQTVELPVCGKIPQLGKQIVVLSRGEQIPYQFTYDGKLIFQVSVPPHQSERIIIRRGVPNDFTVLATGRLHPERVDDMAWENDCIAFRCYGPALQKTGEKSYGNDMWLKSTKQMICDFRYGQEERAHSDMALLLKAGKKAEARRYSDSVSYHIDHGNGMDNYSVGPTLGVGTTGFFLNGKILYPYCFSSYKVLDNGPIRFTVRLEYPVSFNGIEMKEVRVITLDAGSQLNKVSVYYLAQKEQLPVVVGLKQHVGSDNSGYSEKDGYAWCAEDNGKDGTTFTGIAFPTAPKFSVLPLSDEERLAKSQGTSGHLLAHFTVRSHQSLTYYWGGGWSKFGFPDKSDWMTYLSDFVHRLKAPLKVVVH